jgi:hypothetical protein
LYPLDIPFKTNTLSEWEINDLKTKFVEMKSLIRINQLKCAETSPQRQNLEKPKRRIFKFSSLDEARKIAKSHNFICAQNSWVSFFYLFL